MDITTLVLKWHPIETADGDEYGVAMIFALPDGTVGGGRSYKLKDGSRSYSLDSVWLDDDETPTHWMPYPKHPTK